MKREREKHITRLHIILFFLAIIVAIVVIITIKNRTANSDSKYKEFEQELVNAANTYITKLKKLVIPKDREVKLNISILKNSDLLQNELADECVGYVAIDNQKNLDNNYEIVYEAFISCDGYITSGYIDEY